MRLFSPSPTTGFFARLPSWRCVLLVPAVPFLLILVITVTRLNIPLFQWLNTLSDYTGDSVWSNVTLLGEGLLVFALLGPIAGRRPDAAWSLLLAGFIATLAVHGAKELFAMPRPLLELTQSGVHVIGPKLFAVSFPSGHAATISTFATVLGLHITGRRGQAGLAVVVLVVALSRVVVGAHWPVDILAGMIIGWFAGVAGVWMARSLPAGLTRPWQTAIGILSLWAAWLFWDAPTGQHLAVTLQRGSALLAGITGLAVLLRRWWPRRPAATG